MVPFRDPSCLQQQLNGSQTMKILTAEHFIINSASQHAIISHKHLENYRIKFHLSFVSGVSMFLNKILCLQRDFVKMYFGYRQDQRVKGQEPPKRMRHCLHMKFMSLILRLSALPKSFIQDKIYVYSMGRKNKQWHWWGQLPSTLHPRNSFTAPTEITKPSPGNLPTQFQLRPLMDEIFRVNYTQGLFPGAFTP